MPFEPITIDLSATMTPAEVSAKVAEIAAAANPPLPPGSPADARRRLDSLTNDKAFADRLFSNDAEARREFLELSGQALITIGNWLCGLVATRAMTRRQECRREQGTISHHDNR